MAADSARSVGSGARSAAYTIPDGEMAAGSTLGGPACCLVIKATGAIEKFYSVDAGDVLFGTLVLHHWDERTGIHLGALPGTFEIHPERQEHRFTLTNGVAVHETIFVLSGKPDGDRVDPPAAYYVLELRNDGTDDVHIGSYAFCQLRGHLAHDVVVSYDARLRAFLARNRAADPDHVRVFAISEPPTSYESTLDHAKAISDRRPVLPDATGSGDGDPLGVFHSSHALRPGESAQARLHADVRARRGARGAQDVPARCRAPRTRSRARRRTTRKSWRARSS